MDGTAGRRKARHGRRSVSAGRFICTKTLEQDIFSAMKCLKCGTEDKELRWSFCQTCRPDLFKKDYAAILKAYGFKDKHGHPLENCQDYIDLLNEVKASAS